MNILDWTSENKLRSFPLKNVVKTSTDDYVFPDDLVLDALIFSTSEITKITEVVKTSSDITFTVDNGDIFGFDLPVSEDVNYKRLSSGSVLAISSSVNDLDDFDETFETLIFEDAVCFDYSSYVGVTSLTFNEVALSGAIEFVEGYQFGIATNNNILSLAASNYEGLPIDCVQFNESPEEACSTIISYLNGIGPDDNNVIYLREGNQVKVVDDPANNRIFILYSFRAEDVCDVN